MGYKWCAVPLCKNTSNQTPDKLFVSVPKDAKKRNMWLRMARRDPEDISYGSVIFFCEDHFDMEKDMANYYQYKFGFSDRIKLVQGALPSKFNCQQVQDKILIPAERVQSKLYEGYETIVDTTFQKEAKIYATQNMRIKLVDSKGERKKGMHNASSKESVELLKFSGIQDFKDIEQRTNASYENNQTINMEKKITSNHHSEQEQYEINEENSSFRTISIEVLKTENIEDEDIIDQSITIEQLENEYPLATDSCTVPVLMREEKKSKEYINIDSHYTHNKSTSTRPSMTVDKSVQFCFKPKFRSKAVQTRILNKNISSPCTHPTTSRSTSPFKIDTSHCHSQTSIKEIRELETSIRLSDRKMYRSWESVKDSKDPEAFENLLNEVKNKQKTLSCMIQLIENRQAMLSREQKNNEDENDAVVSLPTRRHQDTRRCFKRRKRAHESRSDHKTQIAPKQVTLYITGSSTVDETESTRSSSELPSLELSQGQTPNIMFLTTNLI